jgi:hypothetical protein
LRSPRWVLAELAGGVAERLQELRDRRIAVLQPDRRGRYPDLGETGAQRRLAGDEGRSSGRAALLGVIVDEHHSFTGDAVDVGGLVAHDAVRIGADVGQADVVAEDDEDVRSLTRRCRLRLRLRGLHRSNRSQCGRRRQRCA